MEILKKIPFLKIVYNLEGLLKCAYLLSLFVPEYLYTLGVTICIMATLR